MFFLCSRNQFRDLDCPYLQTSSWIENEPSTSLWIGNFMKCCQTQSEDVYPSFFHHWNFGEKKWPSNNRENPLKCVGTFEWREEI